jgi:hypothetical protein
MDSRVLKSNKYIGLSQISQMYYNEAIQLSKNNSNKDLNLYAKDLFYQSIIIFPHEHNLVDYADFLDDVFNMEENAIEYYKQAIEEFNSNRGAYNLSITYECMSKNEKYTQDEQNKYLYESLKFCLISTENATDKIYELDPYYHFLDIIGLINKDSTSSPLSMIEIYNIIKDEVKKIEEKTSIFNYTPLKNINEIVIKILYKWKHKIENYSDIIIYNNKIKLFERLNNNVECGICFEEKLNIDLCCGHTICKDCYPKVYTSACPYCRIKFCKINEN